MGRELWATARVLRETAASLNTEAARLERLADGAMAQAGDAVTRVVASRSSWTWRETGRRSGVTYPWPSTAGEPPNREPYDPFVEFEGIGSEGRVRMGVGECRRDAWGKNRRYAIVFIVRPGSIEPVVEFLEADEGESFVAIIRGKGRTGRQMFAPGDQLPAAYEHLPVGRYRDYVGEGYRRLVIVAHEADTEVMLEHALIQARMRYGYRPEIV